MLFKHWAELQRVSTKSRFLEIDIHRVLQDVLQKYLQNLLQNDRLDSLGDGFFGDHFGDKRIHVRTGARFQLRIQVPHVRIAGHFGGAVGGSSRTAPETPGLLHHENYPLLQ